MLFWSFRPVAGLSLSARRAWIEIEAPSSAPYAESRSLSARRAWIEIRQLTRHLLRYLVALRKESVDRNDAVQIIVVVMHASLSARRAWIEMPTLC